ncbi:MAG: hypothetical protein AB1393_09020 [Candidatus Edwardsbacteria bacterium]
MKKVKENINIKDLEERFERLRKEVVDYRPERFEYLERRFYELYQSEHPIFRQIFCGDSIKKGECPVREWLKVNYYPVTTGEVEFLKIMRQLSEKLTEESFREYKILMGRYLMHYKNSKALQEKQRKLTKQGINTFQWWMEKHGLKPAFKEV